MSWGELTVGGYRMEHLDERVPPELLAVFDDSMYRRRRFDPTKDRHGWERTARSRDRRRKVHYPEWAHELVGPGPVIADRLDALGVNRIATARYYDECIQSADPGGINSEQHPTLSEFTGEQWISALTRAVQSNMDDLYWLMVVEEERPFKDFRFMIRAMLLAERSQEVLLDISSITVERDGTFVGPTKFPATMCSDALAQVRASASTNAPLVVLTEGKTDARLLAAAIAVTYPHLTGFVRFMDFEIKAEGSAAALAKLVRSFIAGGIANRVIALADNDTAAYDALHRLKSEGIPDTYRILHFPDLPLLRRYPTLGPQLDDPVIMDVNRKAGALEMYLGRDLLAVDGELVPVQWTGYIEGQKRYQGALSNKEKSRIQTDFEAKVQTALKDPAARQTQDWSGIVAIVEAILAAFD